MSLPISSVRLLLLEGGGGEEGEADLMELQKSGRPLSLESIAVCFVLGSRVEDLWLTREYEPGVQYLSYLFVVRVPKWYTFILGKKIRKCDFPL